MDGRNLSGCYSSFSRTHPPLRLRHTNVARRPCRVLLSLDFVETLACTTPGRTGAPRPSFLVCYWRSSRLVVYEAGIVKQPLRGLYQRRQQRRRKVRPHQCPLPPGRSAHVRSLVIERVYGRMLRKSRSCVMSSDNSTSERCRCQSIMASRRCPCTIKPSTSVASNVDPYRDLDIAPPSPSPSISPLTSPPVACDVDPFALRRRGRRRSASA
ncbi:hypothetical protein BD626DRAFT_80923 [Schizophyllum amplum]|uniref:Uncharacterized protein n=1 Tax=Schizophyllum amplum TaxID=97359 RepID=A0A550C9Z7_9AGAR|nr:hypothetical protein BD626DRAFT_80923 [Auriculariopsis ampla]